LRRRDRGCRFPGCTNHRFVDAHDVRHWAKGGETSIGNLLLLCRRHHRLVHEGSYRVESLPDRRVRFRHPSGVPIPDAPRPPPGCADRLLERNRRTGLAIRADTCRNGDGDPMHHRLVVDALLQIAGDRPS
jgi:hypothetical protein